MHGMIIFIINKLVDFYFAIPRSNARQYTSNCYTPIILSPFKIGSDNKSLNLAVGKF
jgi:hypothetical protein